jgi:hypothetical protein
MGMKKIITWKFHWNRPRNKWYKRANIVKNLYYGKCTGKRDFTLQNFLFRQTMCWNLKFLTAEKKIRQEKPNFFAIGSVVFAPLTYATELKEWTIELKYVWTEYLLQLY